MRSTRTCSGVIAAAGSAEAATVDTTMIGAAADAVAATVTAMSVCALRRRVDRAA